MDNAQLQQLLWLILGITALILGVSMTFNLAIFAQDIPEKLLPASGKIVARITPTSGQTGTLFHLRVASQQRVESQELVVEVGNKEETVFVRMFDDGNNYDEGIGDGIYGAHLDSTNLPVGEYTITYEGKELSTFTIEDVSCETIKGPPGPQYINFLLLPAGYDDYQEFKQDAQRVLNAENAFTNKEPFTTREELFSYTILDTKKLECDIGCYGVPEVVCCNDKQVLEEAAKCHYDSLVVLVNGEQKCGSATSYTKICAKNEASPVFLMHEIGHSFAGLDDEYVYSQNYELNNPTGENCALEGCNSWAGTSEGCFPGCTTNNFFRSTETQSVMLDLYPEYNLVSTTLIINIIDNFLVREQTAKALQPTDKSYVVNLAYKNGELEASEIYVKPLPAGRESKASDYHVRILDNQGQTLDERVLYVPKRIYPLPPSTITNPFPDFVEFATVLPYYQEATQIEIYEKEEKVAEENIGVFAQTCGNNICEPYENRLSCSWDCDIQDGLCESQSGCDPDCPSKKNCQLEEETQHYLPFILITLSLLIFITLYARTRKK